MIKVDSHSSTWRNIKAYVDERCAALSARTDALTLNWEETQQTRARIAELKALIAETQVEEVAFVSEDFELPN